MKGYFRKFFIIHLIIILVIAFAIARLDIPYFIATLLYIALIELLFYYLNTKYLPKKKTELTNRLIAIFGANYLSEGVLKFKMESIDLFIKIEIDFKKGFQLASIGTIKFYIPKSQIRHLLIRSVNKPHEDKIDGIQTYNFYQSSGLGMRFIKEDIAKMIRI